MELKGVLMSELKKAVIVTTKNDVIIVDKINVLLRTEKTTYDGNNSIMCGLDAVVENGQSVTIADGLSVEQFDFVFKSLVNIIIDNTTGICIIKELLNSLNQ